MIEMLLAVVPKKEPSVEIIGFVAVNILTLIFGGILSALSYRAYSRRKIKSFKIATIAFVIITIGSVIEAIYEIGVRRSFELSGQELIILHSAESLLLAIGLGLLFYSILQQ